MSKIRRFSGGINDKGYALIAVTFIMVSFLSVIFLASYPLVKEARDETGSYIVDRNDYRFRKALFGETVDQCGTKLAHCGGLYSDYLDPGKSGRDGFCYQMNVIARIFGIFARQNTHQNEVSYPQGYKWRADGFWAGYWPKRYLDILPSDKWDYTTMYPDVIAPYKPYLQTYAHIVINNLCETTPSCINYTKQQFYRSFSSFNYVSSEDACVEVKDYSENKNRHTLRVVSIGSDNAKTSMDFEMSREDTTNGDYVFYRFEQQGGGSIKQMASHSGQKKLIIQVCDNNNCDCDESGECVCLVPWITVETRLLVHSPYLSSVKFVRGQKRTVYHGKGEFIFRVNFYG